MGRAPGLKRLPQPPAALPASVAPRGGKCGEGCLWALHLSDFNQEPALAEVTPSAAPDKPQWHTARVFFLLMSHSGGAGGGCGALLHTLIQSPRL